MLNHSLLDSFLLEEIKNSTAELIAYHQNDKAKVYSHLKSLVVAYCGVVVVVYSMLAYDLQPL